QTYYLTTLFLDMQGFSSLQEDERTKRVNMLRGISQTILEQSAAKYVNTWGDAIVACFDDANIGLACARQLMNALRSVDIHIRIGMSRGETLVKGNPLIGRLDIEGDSVN